MEIVESLLGRRSLAVLLLLALVAAALPLSILSGTVYKPWDVLRLLQEGSSDAGIVLALRARRAFVALLVGALLGGAGALTQASFRNPMASPFTLGISQASALGVAVALVTGIGGTGGAWVLSFSRPTLIALFAFAFAVVQVFVVLALSWKAGLDPRALVLSSIAISFVYQAALYLMQYLVLNEVQLATVIFWTFGDLGRAGWSELGVLAAGASALLPVYVAFHKDLDLLSFGDELAASSGVSPRATRLVVTLVAALGAALATAFVGILAFLCLVSPHLARLLVGGRHRYLVPASMLTGSLLLLVSDAASRSVLSPVVLPVGIVLSLIGAPVLVALLLRGSGRAPT